MVTRQIKIQADAFDWIKKHKKDLFLKFADISLYEQDPYPTTVFMAGSPGAGKTEFSDVTLTDAISRGGITVTVKKNAAPVGFDATQIYQTRADGTAKTITVAEAYQQSFAGQVVAFFSQPATALQNLGQKLQERNMATPTNIIDVVLKSFAVRAPTIEEARAAADAAWNKVAAADAKVVEATKAKTTSERTLAEAVAAREAAVTEFTAKEAIKWLNS